MKIFLQLARILIKSLSILKSLISGQVRAVEMPIEDKPS